ncbi:MAG: S-layer homology domain-containing protein, partial [Pseudoflavonifractor sp.]
MGTFTSSASVQIPLEKIPDGSHKLTVEGKDAQGDSFQAELSFDVDTLAPNLMLTSPVSGSMFGKTDGSVTISGVTDADARFTITSDGAPIGTALQTVAQLGGTINSAGVFSFTVKIPDHNSASNRTLGIIAADAAGNSVTKQVQVTHGGLADLKSINILVDGSALSYGNIPVTAVGETTKQLTLAGVTSDNSAFQLTPSHVSWVCQAVEGDVSVTPDGQLTAAPQSQGMITGRIEVATNAFRTASLSVGASNGSGVVAVSSSIGGSVTGGGTYNPNETVTLTAVPDGGYVFSGWTVEGVTPGTGLSANPLVFTMPTTGNVTVSASFSPIDGGSTGSKTTTVKAGAVGKLPLPHNADPLTIAPYYVDKNGKKVIVALSAVIDGKLVFVAPADARYSTAENPVKFSDIAGNWAERQIRFAAARGLFEGVGKDLFHPAGSMTRSMFVTVLHRMAGSPEPKQPAGFADVSKDAWYAQAVAWASENAIVSGYSSRHFGSDDLVTREQMCVLFARYLRHAGYTLPAKGAPAAFADAPEISAWAKEDTAFCRSIGLMQGKPGN